ncbi:hypothetical protein [Pseudogulbenkiania subflava]|uniref:Uncharacterized protein n=1 Tax=Pseudogulbenkiania subflava DSM 22618 TaxID=1123014 RepID=A0A1Y6BCF9_9NEIS|nr:hypothetical protein [Pseudogulbenkiania subflava]SMF04011.1 hypothetical protein SAMN02745746_00918 [Pseudogulbenkiania subflava DSM 22618]
MNNPFATATATTASTNMPAVILAAAAIHDAASPTVSPGSDFGTSPSTFRVKTILGGERERWGG